MGGLCLLLVSCPWQYCVVKCMRMCCPQKPGANFIRALLLLALYIPLFSPRAYVSPLAAAIYTNILRVRPSIIAPFLYCLTTPSACLVGCNSRARDVMRAPYLPSTCRKISIFNKGENAIALAVYCCVSLLLIKCALMPCSLRLVSGRNAVEQLLAP